MLTSGLRSRYTARVVKHNINKGLSRGHYVGYQRYKAL